MISGCACELGINDDKFIWVGHKVIKHQKEKNKIGDM